MGGGPDKRQVAAADANLALSKQAAADSAAKTAREAEDRKVILPYITSRLQGGLPFFNALTDSASGTNARAFAPAYASLARRFAGQPLPSGAQDAAIRDLDSQRASAFDANLMQALFANEGAKQDAASLLAGQQGLALSTALQGQQNALSGNRSVLDAQSLTHPGVGGIIGGIAGAGLSGLLSNRKLPF